SFQGRCEPVLRLGNQVVGLGSGLDRVLRRLERRLRNEDRHCVRVDLGLERRRDADGTEDLLDLLRLTRVGGDCGMHHLAHCAADDTGSASRRCAAPPLTSCGPPRSGNGTSIASKSLGTTLAGKIACASFAISGPKYRFDRCVNASIATPACRPTSAAWVAVWWSVSAARSRSSSANVASVTSTSASHAAPTTLS